MPLRRSASPSGRPVPGLDPRRLEAQGSRIAISLLGDLSPFLGLLPLTERRRAEALAAWGVTVARSLSRLPDDDARRAAVERFERERRQVLAGGSTGQPAPTLLSLQAARRPWPETGLSELAEALRQRAALAHDPRGDHGRSAERRLASAVCLNLLGYPPTPALLAFAAALFHLRWLQELVPRAGLPTALGVGRRCEALRPDLLGVSRDLPSLAPELRPAVLFLLLAALRISTRLENVADEPLGPPPHLGRAGRLGLLLRARWQAWKIRSGD